MNYLDIRNMDTLNGPGFRTVLFVSGCNHQCKGCHNPETWPLDSGKQFLQCDKTDIISSLRDPYVNGLTITGGDPFHPSNRAGVQELCQLIRNDDITSRKSIWVYTGYTYEELDDSIKSNILPLIDVLVDGPFILEKRDTKILYAGSSNQRLIDIKASLESGEVKLWKSKF